MMLSELISLLDGHLQTHGDAPIEVMGVDSKDYDWQWHPWAQLNRTLVKLFIKGGPAPRAEP